MASRRTLRQMLSIVDNELKADDLEKLKFLCAPSVKQRRRCSLMKNGHELFELLEQQSLISQGNLSYLCELLRIIERVDLMHEALEVESDSSATQPLVCPFRAALVEISENLSSSEISLLRYMYGNIPHGKLFQSGLDLFTLMMERADLKPEAVDKLMEILENIERNDLSTKLQDFQLNFVHNGVYSWKEPVDAKTQLERSSGELVLASVSEVSTPSLEQPSEGKGMENLSTKSSGPLLCSLGSVGTGGSVQTPTPEVMEASSTLTVNSGLPSKNSVSNLTPHRSLTYQHVSNFFSTLHCAPVDNIPVTLEEAKVVGGSESSDEVDAKLLPKQSPPDESLRRVPGKVPCEAEMLQGDEGLSSTPCSRASTAVETKTQTSLAMEDLPESLSRFTLASGMEGGPKFYKMDSQPRGYCVIINNERFTHDAKDSNSTRLKERKGSNIDAEALQRTFKRLHFIPKVHNNLTAGQLREVLQGVATANHSALDCFVCCVLTHGGDGYVYGSDGRRVYVREFATVFRSEACPTLAGKPKLFFLACCQGKSSQGGLYADVQADGPGQGEGQFIPNEADFLFGYATVPGYLSYRSCSRGTWYITELTKALDQFAHRYSLLSLLTHITNQVSEYNHTMTEGEQTTLCIQVPAPQMTLRADIKFL